MQRNFLPKQNSTTITRTVLLILGLSLMMGVLVQGKNPLKMPPQVAVSPSRVEVSTDKPQVQPLRFLNFSDQEVKLDVSVVPWRLDENNAIEITPPSEQTLDQWIIINPVSFSVPARSAQTVRFSIRPRVEPQVGEHRAMIYFTQSLPEKTGKGVQVAFRVGVAVYAHTGEEVRTADLNEVTLTATKKFLEARLDITNTGNSHVRMAGHYAIWPEQEFPGLEDSKKLIASTDADSKAGKKFVSGLLPSLPVLPGDRRTIPFRLAHKLPSGPYILVLTGMLGDGSVSRTLEFKVPADKLRMDVAEPDESKTSWPDRQEQPL